MNSTTQIVLNLQAPNIAVVAAGKQNDRASRTISAQLRDGDAFWTPPAGVAAMIRYAKPDGTAGFYDVLEDGTAAYTISGSVITFTMVEQALTVPGNVWVEINFYTETEKLTTFYFLLEVQRSVLTDATIISSDYYNVLSQQIQALLGATTNPPKIDPTTKNWLLWDEDTGAYVDSGFSSIGTTGPTGPQGVSITTVTKASGTGAPGTTDVYNVNKSDGTVAGQFDVYNGADGQGSPGSATPLADSGSGVVGTATAYSREDHQHPLNVDDAITPSADAGSGSAGANAHYARADHVHPLNVDGTDPAALGTAAPGSAATYARRDHVHPMPTADDVGAMDKWALLWQNASPTSDFPAQTVTIDYSGYDLLAIKSRINALTPTMVFQDAQSGLDMTAWADLDAVVRKRAATIVSTGIEFSAGVQSGNNNAILVPLEIFGIKGVQS